MKRQSLLFIAGGLMALASCTSEPAATGNDMSQAQIDSAVNARVEEMRIEMMASNDSLINEMALYKADSMCAAMKGTVTSKPRPAASKPTGGNTAVKPAEPSTIGNGKPRVGDKKDQDPNTIGNGKPKMGDKKDQDPNTIGNGKPKVGR